MSERLVCTVKKTDFGIRKGFFRTPNYNEKGFFDNFNKLFVMYTILLIQ